MDKEKQEEYLKSSKTSFWFS